jgi:photosystem II stability/assembly factor-like uncharacterized protein
MNQLLQLTIIISAGWWAIVACSPAASNDQAADAPGDMVPVASLIEEFGHNHLHGLGYDADNERLLLATHYGLFAIAGERLYQLGTNRDDFMGFSVDVQSPEVMFASGHPLGGGNLGVLRSDDGGQSWQQIFRGVADETVDFHSMTLSPVDPQRLYGAFQARLYVTQDGGQTWSTTEGTGLPWQAGFCWGVPCLTADTQDADKLYAGTAVGLYYSQDAGQNWQLLTDEPGMISSVGISPQDNRRLIAYTERLGVAISEDGGQSWQAVANGPRLAEGDYVFAFTFHPQNDQLVFLATVGNEVYRSQDGGQTWERLLGN